MSTRRTRTRAASYTARLQQRGHVPRRRRRPPAWLLAPPLLALLLLGAEAGHLAAAVIEWPESPARGLFQVCAAGVQGVAAVGVYFGHTGLDLAVGLVGGTLVPVVWLAGVVAGASVYQEYPLRAAVAGSALEVTAAVLLAMRWRTTAADRRGVGSVGPGRTGRRPAQQVRA